MAENTNKVLHRRRPAPAIDDTDRRILGLLSDDAGLSYAQLGERVNLSPPAVHERVKKMRAMGVIKKTTLALDAGKIGRPLLAFVSVTMERGARTRQCELFLDDPDIEEAHSVAGEACVLLKARCANAEGLEALLDRIYARGGVRSTNSTIVLTTFFERGPQPTLCERAGGLP